MRFVGGIISMLLRSCSPFLAPYSVLCSGAPAYIHEHQGYRSSTLLNKYWLSTDQETWASFSLTKLVILLLSSCICKTGFQTKRGGWLHFAERHLFYLELESGKLLIVDRLDHWKLSVASEPWIRKYIKAYQRLSNAFFFANEQVSPLKLLLLSSSHVLEHPLLVSGALSVFHFSIRFFLIIFCVWSLFSFISLSNCPISINPNPDRDLRLSLHAPLRPSLPTQQTLPTSLRALSSNFHLTKACSHQVLRTHLWSNPPAADRQVQEADSQAREGTYGAAAAS